MARIADRNNLVAAWERVFANRGAPGIDGITCSGFDQRKDDEIRCIQTDLLASGYRPSPVQTISVLKESGKLRIIGLMTIRDRVCAFAVARVLRSLIEPCLQPCSYAYRPGRSATDAANYVEKLIRRGLPWVLETDIASYFDTINHRILLTELTRYVDDDAVIDLIEKFMTAPVTGVERRPETTVGITQGSPLSPLLSNLYLNELDRTMLESGFRYIRYADDLVVLGYRRDDMLRALELLATETAGLELKLSEPKTRIGKVSDGLVFLGFHFDESGKGPAMKSIESIREKLRETAAESGDKPAGEQIRDLCDVLRGWRQYFETSEEVFRDMPHSVLAAAVCDALDAGDPELLRQLTVTLWSAQWTHSEIHMHTARQIRHRKRDELAACQYVTVLMCDDVTREQGMEALEFLDVAPEVWDAIRLRIAHVWAQIPDPDAWRTLAEIFAEAGAFDLAQMMDARSRGRELPVTAAGGDGDDAEVRIGDADVDSASVPDMRDDLTAHDSESAPESVELTDEAVMLYMKMFRGRDGVIGEEYIDERGNKSYHRRDMPLTRERLVEHFSGKHTFGLYIMQPNDTVNLCLLDIDVKKRFILTRSEQGRGFEDLLQQAHAYAFELYDCAKSMGVQPAVEDSGYKGRHLWLFFTEPLAPALARQILSTIQERAGPPPEAVAVEMFPSRDHAKKDTLGDLVKLPLGRNRKSGRFAWFINRDGTCADPTQALHAIRPVTRAKLKQLMDKNVFKKKSLRKIVDPVDINMGDLDGIPARGPVRRVVKQCHLMRFFISKAQKVGHLTHMERVAMLHVFGHLEDEGRAFLHRVMAFCMNYDPNYTQAQIGKLKPSPISCPRLKETFPQISNSVKCNCHFGSLKDNAYPTPVLWADDGFFGTASVSPAGSASGGTVSRAGTTGPQHESGDDATPLQNEADELVKKYMNIRNNYRGVQKAIHRLEDRLVEIMKQLQVDAVETSFGVLRCVESDGGRPRFIIEI